MIMPVGQMILADTAGPARMGRVMSITGVPTMIAPILGPTIGGLILQSISWRWIFYVNVPIGAIALFLALRILPAAAASRERPPRLDVTGLLLMATGMPALTYGLAEIGITGGFTSDRVVVPLIAGVVLLVAVRPARAARRRPAARPAPVPPAHLRGRVGRDVLPRRRAVRRADPAAALLPAAAARQRHRHRAAARAAGARHGGRDAVRRPAHRPHRRRPAASSAAC